MKNALRTECYKAFHNRLFYIALAALTLVSLLATVEAFLDHLHTMDGIQVVIKFNEDALHKDLCLPADTLYNSWPGGSGDHVSFATELFFFLTPLFAAFPFGWSLLAERKSGYAANAVSRCGSGKYHLAKYFACFLSGGVTVFFPLALSFLLTALFVPARMPDPAYELYYPIGSSAMWASLFYTNPLLFDLLFLLLNFIFGGLFACLPLAAASFFRNRFVVLIAPYLLILGIHYLTHQGPFWAEYSPIYFLRAATHAVYATHGIVVFLWGAALFLLTFYFAVVRGRRRDVL